MSKASCVLPSIRSLFKFDRFKEPEHLFFRPPATPSNRQEIDDEAHISDPHWLAPGGPTRRELASDASFPVQKHFVLSPIIYTIFPNCLTLVHCDIPRATRRSPFYFPAPHQPSPETRSKAVTLTMMPARPGRLTYCIWYARPILDWTSPLAPTT